MRLFLILLLYFFTACNYLPAGVPGLSPAPVETPTESAAPKTTPVYSYIVVNTYLHDPDAFTQGLDFADGFLYESTGLFGASSLRKVDLNTGEVLKRHDLAPTFFGEGCAVFGDRIYQLTWRERTCFVYDKNTFEILAQHAYPTEGWGITHNGKHLIMSDGSATLYFRDPETFEETGRVAVSDHTGPVRNLNELEYIHGEVYANIWQTDRIARIDPKTGKVIAYIDLSGILPPQNRRIDVLNGIAHDPERDRLFVTGKWWPTLFEIRLVKNP